MWEFVKISPWICGISISIILIGIIGIIVSLVMNSKQKDYGLIYQNEKLLKWELFDLPLGVIFHSQLTIRWQKAFQNAAMQFNACTGREVFAESSFANPGYDWDKFPPTGFIGIRPVGLDQDMSILRTIDAGGAITEHRYDSATGRILSVVITLPDSYQGKPIMFHLREPIMLHELGHVLGLAHNPMKNSIMHAVLSERIRAYELSISDKKLLQEIYGW